MTLLSPSKNYDPLDKEFPMWDEPDEKITVEKLISVLRDHCEGTKYDSYPKDGNVYRRPVIGSPRVIHTNVIKIRENIPVDIGAVLYTGLSMPSATVYVPFWYGINEIPHSYESRYESEGSAFHVYKDLADILLEKFNTRIKKVESVLWTYEKEMLNSQKEIEKKALELYKKNPESAKEYLTKVVKEYCAGALEKAVRLTVELQN